MNSETQYQKEKVYEIHNDIYTYQGILIIFI